MATMGPDATVFFIETAVPNLYEAPPPTISVPTFAHPESYLYTLTRPESDAVVSSNGAPTAT